MGQVHTASEGAQAANTGREASRPTGGDVLMLIGLTPTAWFSLSKTKQKRKMGFGNSEAVWHD